MEKWNVMEKMSGKHRRIEWRTFYLEIGEKFKKLLTQYAFPRHSRRRIMRLLAYFETEIQLKTTFQCWNPVVVVMLESCCCYVGILLLLCCNLVVVMLESCCCC